MGKVYHIYSVVLSQITLFSDYYTQPKTGFDIKENREMILMRIFKKSIVVPMGGSGLGSD